MVLNGLWLAAVQWEPDISSICPNVPCRGDCSILSRTYLITNTVPEHGYGITRLVLGNLVQVREYGVCMLSQGTTDKVRLHRKARAILRQGSDLPISW
jgi:hypothetical protein